MHRAVVFALALLVAAGAWGQERRGGDRRVLNAGVADFGYQGTEGHEWLALGVADMLRQFLGRLPAFRVVDGLAWRDQADAVGLSPGVRDPAELQRLGGGLHLKYVVRGELERLSDDEFLARAQIVHLEDGKTWREHQARFGLPRFFDGVAELMHLLLDEWGVKLSREDRARLAAYVPTRSPLAFEFYCQGLRLYESDDPETALRVWQRALQFDAQCALVHSAVGRASYQRAQQLARLAEESFQRALAAGAQNADAHFALGVSYQHRGRHDLAEAEYIAAVQANPNHLEAHYNLGVIYLDVHRRASDAVGRFQEVLRIAPHYVQAMNNLGVAYYREGFRDRAVKLWQDVLRIEPDNALARSNLERYRVP